MESIIWVRSENTYLPKLSEMANIRHATIPSFIHSCRAAGGHKQQEQQEVAEAQYVRTPFVLPVCVRVMFCVRVVWFYACCFLWRHFLLPSAHQSIAVLQ